SRRRHTRFKCDWSSDVCSSDLGGARPDWRIIRDIGARLGLSWANLTVESLFEDMAQELPTLAGFSWRMMVQDDHARYPLRPAGEIGRASCRERGEIEVVRRVVR